MGIRIATWNINSVRLREDLVCRFLNSYSPDILCLQEIKTPTEFFPRVKFENLGYNYILVRGQKSYNGVAIISRIPIEDKGFNDFCLKGDARHLAARLDCGLVLHNIYVPAGGDLPDRSLNDKFGHKIDFLVEMKNFFQSKKDSEPKLLLGDLNIAPMPYDVWSHKQLLKVVSHTPLETEHLNAVLEAGNFVDLVRKDKPEGLLYSWWSYRSPNWSIADKGRRLDHIWASEVLSERCHSSQIIREIRGWERPSDHVPVMMEMDI